MSALIRSESNLNSAQMLTQVCQEQQLIIEQQDGLIQELVEANNELRETVNAQRDEIQSQQIDIECHVQKIDEGLKTIADYQGLVVMAQDMAARANSRLSELQIHIARILTAKDKATGKDLLMVTYVSDIPKVLSSMKENHQIVKINEFHAKLTKNWHLIFQIRFQGKLEEKMIPLTS